MKRLVLGLIAVILSLGGVSAAYAGGGGHGRSHHGDRSHHGYGFHHGAGFHHGGLFFGVGRRFLFSRSSFFYPQRRVIAAAPAPPTTYVQQPQYWYYCTDPVGYHPYVSECPPGWMQVVPQSPPR